MRGRPVSYKFLWSRILNCTKNPILHPHLHLDHEFVPSIISLTSNATLANIGAAGEGLLHQDL